MLSHRIRRETPSVLVKSSSFHRILSSASILPLPDSLQYFDLAVPTIPGSGANLHHLSLFHHSYLRHASSILLPGYTFPLPCCERTTAVPRRRLHRRDFSNLGTLLVDIIVTNAAKFSPLSTLQAFLCSRVHASALYGLYDSSLEEKHLNHCLKHNLRRHLLS